MVWPCTRSLEDVYYCSSIGACHKLYKASSPTIDTFSAIGSTMNCAPHPEPDTELSLGK